MMRRWTVAACLAGLATVTAGCSGVPELPEMIDGDWQPAVLTAVRATATDAVTLVFDEEVNLQEIAITPEQSVSGSRWTGAGLEVQLGGALEPGAEYWIDARVEDVAGNISSVLVSFYGLNPRLPPVLINEVVCEGSGNHTDWVELRTTAAGNLGGLTLYEGTPTVWDSRFVFPAVEVDAGAFLVVHFKPEGIPEEIDETEDSADSGGRDATPGGWDFWVVGGDGIPNTTGALSLAPFPGGPVGDAILYTTKSYDAADPLRGFGLASQLEMMEELTAAGSWNTAGDEVIPEDLFDPEDSTATRSINRTPGAPDSDSPLDWHIGPTSSASPGAPNTTEHYVP